ncbi:MAG: TolC family protein [Ignavibacteriales bacterium]|nr:TolC family protein [Ignavibacteriales bacterium]
MTFHLRIFLILFFFFSSLLQLNAQIANKESNSSLTLAESVRLAQENNKSILLARESILGAEAKMDESRSVYFPQLRLDANYTRLNTFSTFKFEIPGLPAEEFKLGTQNNYNAQVALNQSLFNWGRNGKMVEMNEIELLQAKHSAAFTEREVTYLTVQLYYQILMMSEAIKVINENLSLLEQRLSTMKKKYEAGETSSFDILSMEVQISSVNGEILNAETSLRKLKIQFNKIIGRSLDTFVQLQDSLTYIKISMDEKMLFQEAFANRIELKQLQEREKQASLQKDISSTMNKPNVDLFFNWDLRNGYLPKVDIFKGSWNAGLSFSLPLFDGFRTSSQVQQAEVSLKITQMQYDNTKDQIAIEIKNVLLDLQTKEKQIEIEQKKIELTKQSLATAEERYYRGLVSTLDLLDVQQSLQTAKLNYVQAVGYYIISKYSLQKSVGRNVF